MRYRDINEAADAAKTLAVKVQDLRQDVGRNPTTGRQFALTLAEQELKQAEWEEMELFDIALERHQERQWAWEESVGLR